MCLRSSVSFFLLALACACSSSSSTEPADSGHHEASASSSKSSSHDAGHDVAKGADASDAQADVTEKHEAEVDAVAPPKDTGPHLPDGYAFDGPVFTVEAGVTWSSLYRDYFGPTGVASCEKEGFCHGTTSGVGYQTSSFLCPTGDGGVTTCWQTMTAADGGYLVTPDAGESFADSNLGAILCYPANPGGRMPTNGDETCAYYFTASDIQRISDWIATGALDN